MYVPSGLIGKTSGGHFIQDGDDNVDMNTETIGKKYLSCDGQSYISKERRKRNHRI